MRLGSTFAVVAFIAGCGPSTNNLTVGSGAPSASSSRLGADPSTAAASASAGESDLTPKTLVRKKTPSDLRKSDEDACAAGKSPEDIAACKRVADRYRGYGAPAGCGVDRGRPHPFVKVIAEDTDSDERGYAKAIGRACQLGDADACNLAKFAFRSYNWSSESARHYAVRSDPHQLGIWTFREKAGPEWGKVMLDQRQSCLVNGYCGGNEQIYFRRDVAEKEEPKLSADRAAIYIEACKSTHDCDEMWMMLDKDRYVASDVEPIRKAFGETLSEACLAGECTCGHAVRYLSDDDPKALDLAILGCNDGEAEGCFELGKRLEEGRGIAKDEKRAVALYNLACPSMYPREGTPGPRAGEYSKRACDRLADLAAGGNYPPKDWTRAMFYAHHACTDPGSEIDHGACVRLGRFWETNPNFTGRNGQDARDAAYGARDYRLGLDCNRPSVKDACDAFDKGLAQVK